MASPYKMTISRLTVDKLGVKLYDRVSAVIAELVANSYDADAEKVEVVAPMGELLATKKGAQITDKGLTIEIRDDGIGMTPDEVNDFYLVVGAERRKDTRRGDLSQKHQRKVMGRKGVGKLAPFGVCQEIEIISSGGKRKSGNDNAGRTKKGYETAHLILDRNQILKDTDQTYRPKAGNLDGTIRPRRGTTLILRIFDHRRVPSIEDFERQLSQRFGVASPDWQITLTDSLTTEGDPQHQCVVGQFNVAKMPHTNIRLEYEVDSNGDVKQKAVGPQNRSLDDIMPGFDYDGEFYPVTGWIAYSKQPYKDHLMAGIRIYCRGKIAAQTNIFNLKAGFTGEYDVRSYLIGELHADWLDEAEDLIRTDRQDILWSHEPAQTFQSWGQAIVKKVGKLTREPRRIQAWDYFVAESDFHKRLTEEFPSDRQSNIRENTEQMARLIAKTTRLDELQDEGHVKAVLELSFLLGPHITLDKQLRAAAEDSDDPLSAITGILGTARIAELSAFGRIADDRIRVIKRLEERKKDKGTPESVFQDLIAEAPWLINPEWSPITANQPFTTLRQEFQEFYKGRTGEEIDLGPFSKGLKRADFVLSTQDNIIQIIEIKQPHHSLQKEEMERINNYVEIMQDFLDASGNQDFAKLFTKFHVTLVCDRIGLSGVHKTALEGLKKSGRLTHINWSTFLLRTRKMHEAFLNEAERQRKNAAKD